VVAAAPYAWSNATWSNATTLAVVGTAAAAPLASASAPARHSIWNGTMVPYTGTAGKTGVSFAAALIALMALI
jgi:ABC-type phosphate transport system substrate-binding protein